MGYIPRTIFEPSIRRQYEDVGLQRTLGFVNDDMQTSFQDNESQRAQYTRFMRNQEITFVSNGLCPDANANIFFDKVNVNRFTQKANKLTVTNMSVPFFQDEEIINSTTNAYAKVLTSSNNFVYVNENFINVNIAPYGSNSLSTTTGVNLTVVYEDDVIYQTSSNNYSGPITFAGTVERYERTTNQHAYLVIKPIAGSFRKFSANSVIFFRA